MSELCVLNFSVPSEVPEKHSTKHVTAGELEGTSIVRCQHHRITRVASKLTLKKVI